MEHGGDHQEENDGRRNNTPELEAEPEPKKGPPRSAKADGNAPVSSQPSTPEDERQPAWMRDRPEGVGGGELSRRQDQRRRDQDLAEYRRKQTQQLQRQQMEEGGGGGGGGKNPLRLRLDLNLEVEIELKARIHGDLTLALL